MTDQVMGGVSRGELITEVKRGKACLLLTGAVSTANNGGFVQMSLQLAGGERLDASEFDAIELEVLGNNEEYNLHLKTSDLRLPWQSYRASFEATPQWTTITIPFSKLESYRSGRPFRSSKLTRLGLVAIGREFDAELCVASVKFLKLSSR